MPTRDEQKTWRLNAYNAALTGLLTSKADESDRFLVLTALKPIGSRQSLRRASARRTKALPDGADGTLAVRSLIDASKFSPRLQVRKEVFSFESTKRRVWKSPG
jgi:hypothetical protein